jgi:NhaP-type Na+/H+ or K+/H+ antiporter
LNFCGHIQFAIQRPRAKTQGYVDAFWKRIDEILNSTLFVMIGFEIFAITDDYLQQGF